MWTFKIICTAGYLYCWWNGTQTNDLMFDKTKESCYDSTEFVARYRRLMASDWRIECEFHSDAGFAKRPN